MEEKRYVVGLLSPYLSVIGQKPLLYITTADEIKVFTSDLIELEKRNTANIRFVRGWEEVEVIKIEEIIKMKEGGIVELIKTGEQRKLKIIYTYLKGRVLYVKSTEIGNPKSYKECYYRGYYIDEIKNLGLVTKDGYIPIDKGVGLGNIKILLHNKRKLIKKGAVYIHNHLEGIMGLVDCIYSSEEEMLNDTSEINKGYFIESLLGNEQQNICDNSENNVYLK